MSQDARETKSYPESALNKLELFVGKKSLAPHIKTPHRQLRTVLKASDG